MKKNVSLLAFFVVLYCFGYFVLSTLLYFLSLSQGYDGLGLPMFGGGDDGVFYAEQAINVANDLPAILTSIHVLVLGWILKIFHTENIYVLKAFNYVGNILLVFTSLHILQKMMLERKNFVTAAILLVLLLLYYPSLLLNSNLSIYRDVWICMYYLLSVLFFANLFVVKSRWPFLFNAFILAVSVIMLGGYRKYALMSFLIGSFLYLLFIWNRKRKVKYGKVLLVSVIGFSISYTFLRTVMIPYVNLSFQSVLDYRNSALDAGGSQMSISLDQPNILLFYFNYFYSLISNTFGPLPWQISGASTLLIFFAESLLFIFIFLFLYKRKKQFSKIDILLIIHSTIWFMLISISNDNLGTATRLRMIGWLPLLIVFAKYYAEYLTIRKMRKKHKVTYQKETVIS